MTAAVSSENSYPSEQDVTMVTTATRACSYSGGTHVLLSTALVWLYDNQDRAHLCRALLDSGSQSNFITESFVKRLRLKTSPVNIAGIGQSKTQLKGRVQIKLGSRHNAYQIKTDCIVIGKITDLLPAHSIDRRGMSIPRNLKLADPDFHLTSNVDLLIGAEIFWSLLCVGQIKQSSEHPMLQKTHFGWITCGALPYPVNAASVTAYTRSFTTVVANDELHKKMSEFWQLEDYGSKQPFTRKEKLCEEHFLRNVSRTPQGRFIVSLPTKEDKLAELGESRAIAMRRFFALEKRLGGRPELKAEYSKFMSEYVSLGHMRKVEIPRNDTTPHFYLPHHAVIKESSTTTKLRVVFDGSCKTSSGISLNDILRVGPVIQQDLFSIVERFRAFRYALNADISKMYRQILINSEQTALQRVLWRDDENKDIETFELLTLIYGTSPASFLATRCLSYLSENEGQELPQAATAVARDFYMDDLLTGADSLEEARELRDQIIHLLEKGCLPLAKWSSNAPELLQDIPETCNQATLLKINKDANIRTLGLQWCSMSDCFRFTVPIHGEYKRITKRTILSRIAQIFDPLGLVGPIIVVAKILMQQLWQLHIDWDASLPVHMHTQWSRFERSLRDLNDLRIPRQVIAHYPWRGIQLHGFSDASRKAYGACIYIRITNADGKHSTRLLCAKSRVAPLKSTTIPRLELCGAVLLAQLMAKIIDALPIKFHKKYLWCDSSIVLAWLRSDARWNPFVANRIAEIQQHTQVEEWSHVSTQDNPADLISRGMTPDQLIQASIWWAGPIWLQHDAAQWPVISEEIEIESIPERIRNVTSLINKTNIEDEDNLFNRYSSFDKLSRVIALCRRFLINCKGKRCRQIGSLTHQEIEGATYTLCRQVQAHHFQEEIAALAKGQQVSSRSRIWGLSPILDEQGILRVGGRLRNASLNYSAKHQILLPAKHTLTYLIIRHTHERGLHAGAQATLAFVRLKFWPVAARNTVRKIIGKCITCIKQRPVTSQCRMGDLPAQRVQPSRPFAVCGVDYGGPLYIRDGKRRNSKIIKACMAIFVCFATKAVHLELVGDLSTEAFLNALKRFAARRGKISHIHSDNATNFTGAAKELQELHDLFEDEQHKNKLAKFLVSERITWHFIPPSAPNFGRLWEAAVKSAKSHLCRVIGQTHLNYDEMYTLLTQIEAILNSRPITPLSNEPNDLSFLSPGHFLIGDTLNAHVEPSLDHLQPNRLSRWQHIEQLRQHFWRRWHTEYLNQLQQRTRWQTNRGRQLQQGQMVLVQQQGLPPVQWILGRVCSIYPGADGMTRTATILTSKGTVDRPISKLCILPLDET